jgi:hypothetical protein
MIAPGWSAAVPDQTVKPMARSCSRPLSVISAGLQARYPLRPLEGRFLMNR